MVRLYNPGDQMEALPWGLLTLLLLAIGWGLWRRQVWARVLALVVHWTVFVGAVGLLPLCLYVLLLVPARGIAVAHVFALIGAVLALPILILSGWTIWYLHRRMLR